MFFRNKLIIAAAAFCLISSVYADTNSAKTAPVQKADSTSLSATQAVAKVNINKATKDELMKVKGMNKKRANNILTYRTKHGDFKSLNDLKNVTGFKKMKSEKLKAVQDQLTIG